MTIYTITDWMGLIPLVVCLIFAGIGVVQLIKRRSLFKVCLLYTSGNPPEYNKSMREFDLVTLDRVRRIDIEPKLSVWQDYARAHRLHPAVTAYLEPVSYTHLPEPLP